MVGVGSGWFIWVYGGSSIGISVGFGVGVVGGWWNWDLCGSSIGTSVGGWWNWGFGGSSIGISVCFGSIQRWSISLGDSITPWTF